MSFSESIALTLLGIGTFVLIMDTLGFYRFGNVFARMHAATKGSTVGIGFILVGTMVYFAEFHIVLKLMALIFFLFVTAPVGAQAVARSAYSDTEYYKHVLDKSLVADSLRKHYPQHKSSDK